MPSDFIQYGSFGLICFLIGWYVWYGYPAQAKTFKESLDRVVETFVKESAQCREERLGMAANSAKERQQQRAVQHKTNNILTQMALRLRVEGDLDTPDPDALPVTHDR